MEDGFRPKTAADVRRDHAQLMFGEAQRLHHHRFGAVWCLRAVPDREQIFIGVVARDDAARLDGKAAAFLHAKLFAEAMGRRRKDSIDIAVCDDMLGSEVVRTIEPRPRRTG